MATASPEEIVKKQEDYKKDVDNTHKNLLQLVWYMRGGVSITELHNMPLRDLQLINDVIENNIELSKKAGTPIL
tara:strand:- start:162 stop:383 length:222 start_codon:yes stop_codon:yes gene_type:complete